MSLSLVNLDLDTVGLGTACSDEMRAKSRSSLRVVSIVGRNRYVLDSISYLDDIISLSLFIGLQHLLFLNIGEINVGSFRCFGWHFPKSTSFQKRLNHLVSPCEIVMPTWATHAKERISVSCLNRILNTDW